MERDDTHALSAAYALGALDDADRDAFEEHLARCERCRADVVSLGEAAGALAYAAPPAPAPPRALRERILERARADRPGAERAVVHELRPWRRRTFAAAFAAAAAAAVALALGVWGASVSRELDRERTANAVLADPTARSVGLQGVEGRLVVTRGRDAALVVGGLPEAPAGRTYEIWVIDGGSPVPAGLFRGGSGRDVVLLDEPVPRGATVAVTVERAGGVETPTTEPLFTVSA